MNRSGIVSPSASQVRPSWVANLGASTRVERLLVMLFSQVALIFFTLLILYPVLWMVFASFKTKTEIVDNVWGLPQSLQWQNYVSAWESAKLGYAPANSIITSLSAVILVALLAALAGFAFAKLRVPGLNILFLTMIFTMHAPAPIIPLYVLLVRLGMTDSRIGLILPMVAGGLPLAIFIFRAFFQSIPTELLDAARVDGCTDLGAFARVVLPISSPAIATVAILEFVGAWNEYFLALVLLRSEEMRTVPLAIQVFFYAWGRTEWQQVFAALVIASLPMIVLYILLQRQFIQGLTAGSIKG
jgi:raffinose/stachyose/melibiose transport system permease protein